MSQTLRKHPSCNSSTSQFAMIGTALALVLFSCSAFAAAPNVVVDSQLAQVGGLSSPQAIAVAPNNTRYVADQGNNRVQAYVNNVVSTVSTGAFTLVKPQAVAVDSFGDLFIGDSPSSGVGRVLEALATNGALNGTVNLVVMGGALDDVTALTVDTTSTSSTFNTLYIGDDISNAIYSVAPGSTTLVPLKISGLPTNVVPAALLKDASGNLFVADFLSTVYEVPAGTTTASIYFVTNFTINGPTGLARDPKGNLYILTLTSPKGTVSQPLAPENIIEIPGGDISSAFMIPFTVVENGAGIAFDSLGDLYLVDNTAGGVSEIVYGSPVGLSQVDVNTVGPSINFNYEFNATTKVRGFQLVSSGDVTTEIQNEGGACANGTYKDGNNGGAVSPSNPFTCEQSFAAEPSYPGIRNGAIRLKGTSATILATIDVYSEGIAGESVIYPLTATAGASGITAPVAAAISGLDKTIYVTSGAGAQILSTNGPNGKTLSPVSTAPISLGLPFGIAINGNGDLYVADYRLAEVVVVPANASIAPYAFNPGDLLQHPLSIAFDTSGNLFIGDSGPNGVDADAGTPGYLVEVPGGGGAPFKISTGAVTVIYPQGMAADPYTGDLYVADGGNGDTGAGAKVVHVVANGGATSVVNLGANIVDPVSIVFDPAESYYVLDQGSDTITEVPPSGSFYTVSFDNTLAPIPVALAVSPGTQNFTEVNLASTTSTGNLVYLKGTTSTINFGSLTVGTKSSAVNARLNNIGSGPMTLGDPYVISTGDTTVFSLSNTSTCASGLVLDPATPCDSFYQFTPSGTGKFTSTNTFQTNGFDPNDTVLTLTGRGVR